MSERIYLYGKNPLKEALISADRGQKMPIEKLYLTKQAEEDPGVISLVQRHNIDYRVVTGQEIESLVGKTAIHQGICAELKEAFLYTQLEEVISSSKEITNPLFILIDELEDPHNVGAIIRSATAFGASAVLLPEHNQAPVTGTVIKASAGMVFSIPVVKIGNVNTTLRKLKDAGFWIYGLTGNGETKLEEVKFDTATVIVVGGEGKGIREKTLEICDFKLAISMDERCESLNASNAAALSIYEWRKQNIESK